MFDTVRDDKDYKYDIDTEKRPNCLPAANLISKHGCSHTRIICKFQYKMILCVDMWRKREKGIEYHMEVIVDIKTQHRKVSAQIPAAVQPLLALL